MPGASSNGSEPGMTTHRLEALTDGIFSIAMTLMVLSLALPEAAKGVTHAEFVHLLLGQTDKFLNYALSFVLLALFWIGHHQQFHFIKRTDGRLLWINIFTLMFIALVPFSTSLIGGYPHEWLAEIFFDSNIFILGILFISNWAYATKDHRLVDRSLDSEYIALRKKRGVVTPIVAAIAMGLSFLNTDLCFYVYLLIPVIQGVMAGRHRKMTGDTG